jgi:undecaprenyl-diphosphatase
MLTDFLSKIFSALDLVDKNISSYIFSKRTDILIPYMKFFSFLGEPLGFVILGIFVIVLLSKRNYFFSILLSLGTLVPYTLCHLIKVLVERPRPLLEYRLAVETSFSMPSGHSTIAFALFPILLGLYRQSGFHYKNYEKHFDLGIEFSLIFTPYFIAFSRVYLGMHYLSDVVIGAIIGLVFSALVRKIIDVF